MAETGSTLRQRRGNAAGTATDADSGGHPDAEDLAYPQEQHPKIYISSQDFDDGDKRSGSSAGTTTNCNNNSSGNISNGIMKLGHLFPQSKSVSLLSLGNAGAGGAGGGIGAGSRSTSALSASLSSFSHLTASGSAQFKERLSQLKQSAHHRAAGVIPKVECVVPTFSRSERCCMFTLDVRCSFAPAAVPRARRLQTLVVSIYELLMPICLFIFCFAWCVPLSPLCHPSMLIPWDRRSSFPSIWPMATLYMIWVYFIDKSPEHGGRSSYWFRSLWFWKYFAEYYPASYVLSFAI